MDHKREPYTKLEHELFEAIISFKFTISQEKVLLAFIRKLIGFHKEEDDISISQIMELTKLSNRAVINAEKDLQSMNILSQIKKGTSKSKPSRWKINKDTTKWQSMNTSSLVNSDALFYEQRGSYSMNTSSHTKDINNNKKKIDFKKIRKMLPEFIQNKMT